MMIHLILYKYTSDFDRHPGRQQAPVDRIKHPHLLTRRTTIQPVQSAPFPHANTKTQSTHHNSQRARPRRPVPREVDVHLVVRPERVEHEVRHVPRGVLCPPDVLEPEDDTQDLGEGLRDHVEPDALVLARPALQLVQVLGPGRIDDGGVGEIVGLETKMNIRRGPKGKIGRASCRE